MVRSSLLAALLLSLAAAGNAGPQGAGEGGESEEPTGPRLPSWLELHGVIDGRFAAADPPATWLDGGFGRTRYGGEDRNQDGFAERGMHGLHLGQASLVVRAKLSEDLRAHVQLNLDIEDHDHDPDLLSPVGVVEAFGLWTPVLSESVRLRIRGGITIPPFSLEHPGVAWSTRYTITPSAIGSWLGEEVKSTGVEGTAIVTLPGFNELELQGGVFFGNDSTGALLAWRGFALHDRQGIYREELPLPAIGALTDPRFFAAQGLRTEPFREIDDRPGFHGQARLRFGGHGFVQGGYYDSNGNVTGIEQGSLGRNYTWDTRFAVAGVEIDLGPVTILGQYMDGRAEMGFQSPATVDAPFRAAYGLVSWHLAKSRFTARYDDWSVSDKDLWRLGKDLNDDNGWAATVAWIQELAEHHQVMVEFVRVHVEHPFAATAGERVRFSQEQFQAGYRLSF